MHNNRVTVFVDIEAPQEEIFEIITTTDRRLQLSPLWGVAEIENVSPDYPQEGSQYRVKIIEGEKKEYDNTVTAYQPDRKFAYFVNVDRQTEVTWSVQPSAKGTRLTYCEEYIDSEDRDDDFDQAIRKVIQDWLSNIKRYAELRSSRPQRFLKWLLDRFFLKLQVDQRRVILIILAFQAMGLFSFVLVVVFMGIAQLF